MANHPNRAAAPRWPSPAAAEIAAARTAAGLTQREAADLVMSSLRSWEEWEAGRTRMPPVAWAWFVEKAPARGAGA